MWLARFMMTRMLCSITSSVIPKLRVGALQSVDQPVDQHRIDAGRGLVEQQERGLVHQRHRELEQFLLAKRQLPATRKRLECNPTKSSSASARSVSAGADSFSIVASASLPRATC